MENVNRKRLFIASCLALLVTSLTFAVRAKIEGVFSLEYGLSKEEIGRAFAPAFWGFAIAMFVGGFIIDIVKTRTLVWSAFGMHLVGVVLLIMAKDYTSLLVANIFIGLGNGSVEAACNPLVATIFPDKKTKMLNRFHVWFPGGIVIGGILAWLLMGQLDISWQVLVGLLFIPLAIYGYLFLGQNIPETERVSSGVSYKEMMNNTGAPYTIIATVVFMIVLAVVPSLSVDFSSSWTYAILALILALVVVETKAVNKMSLMFPLVLFCMFLSASTELGTTQFINPLLESKGIDQMIILIVVTGIMAVGRYFAGGLIHKLNPIGVLFASAVISGSGLLLMSIATNPVFTLLSAAVFGIGVCYFWPTMIGFTSEYMPKTGALGMSILGGGGFVAVSMVLTLMGKSIDASGPQTTLRNIATLPVILLLGYIVLTLMVRRNKA